MSEDCKEQGSKLIAIMRVSGRTAGSFTCLDQLRKISEKIIILVNGGSEVEPEIAGLVPSGGILVEVDPSQATTMKSLYLDGLRAALALVSKSDRFFLILKNEPNFDLEIGKIVRALRSFADFAETKSWILLSRKYAEFVTSTCRGPSFSNATSHGFTPALSLAQSIKNPKAAFLANFRVVKFMLVGASGYFVNLAVLTLLSKIQQSIDGTVLASSIAVEISIINNFTWNELFTFRKQLVGSSGILSFRHILYRFGKYNLLSISTFVIQVAVYTILKVFYSVNYVLSSLLAVLLAFSLNYFLSSRWAWHKKNAVVEINDQ